MSLNNFADILCPFPEGVRITVRAKPGLSRVRDIKVVDIGDDKRAIEISVAAEANDGKANRTLIARLAEEWGISKRQIEIKSGKTGRLKIIEIIGDPPMLVQLITDKLT